MPMSGARIRLESQVDVVLKELGSRNAKELGVQLDDACGKLKTVQKGIETSVSEPVQPRLRPLCFLSRNHGCIGADSVGRWRIALAKDLHLWPKFWAGNFVWTA